MMESQWLSLNPTKKTIESSGKIRNVFIPNNLSRDAIFVNQKTIHKIKAKDSDLGEPDRNRSK